MSVRQHRYYKQAQNSHCVLSSRNTRGLVSYHNKCLETLEGVGVLPPQLTDITFNVQGEASSMWIVSVRIYSPPCHYVSSSSNRALGLQNSTKTHFVPFPVKFLGNVRKAIFTDEKWYHIESIGEQLDCWWSNVTEYSTWTLLSVLFLVSSGLSSGRTVRRFWFGVEHAALLLWASF